MYTDSRCQAIERNFSVSVAQYADRNLAGWVLDMLADGRPDPAGGIVCYRFAGHHPALVPGWNPCQDAMDRSRGYL